MQYLLLVKYLVLVTVADYSLRVLGVCLLVTVGALVWQKAQKP
jgi:hypothetical protein